MNSADEQAEQDIPLPNTEYDLRKQTAELIIANKELALQAADKYRIVADFTYDWEIWQDPGGALRYVSLSCERITGYKAAEFIADPGLILQITHPDDQAKVREHLHEDQEKESMELDFRIIKRDGDICWINHICAVVYDENRNCLGRRSSNRDITLRKRDAEIMARSKWRLDNIIEATHIGTWEWNVQTGETVFNETWAQMIGYTLDELAPVSIKTWEKFAHPDDLKQSMLLLKKHFSG